MPTSYTTRYVPSVHGFHFGNEFRMEIGAINFWGRCNGMSWTSLDYFNAGRPAPSIRFVEFENKARSGPAAVDIGGVVQLFSAQDGPFGDRPAGCTLAGTGFSVWNYCAEGVTRHGPAVAGWPDGTTHMLAIGTDDGVYHCAFTGNLAAQSKNCSGWLPGFAPIGGTTAESPALVAPFEGRLEAYAVGIGDRALYFRYMEGGSWRGWSSLGTPPGLTCTSSPAAVSWYGFMSGFVRASDGAFWQVRWQDGGWQPWRSLGGVLDSGPAACKIADGIIQVFGRGMDGAIWTNRFEGDWRGWGRVSAPPVALTPDAPAAVVSEGVVYVFAKAGDYIWRLRVDTGEWTRIYHDAAPDSRQLTDAILEKNMSSTIRPLIAATGPLGLGLPFLGAVRNYVTWRSPSDDGCFRWSSQDELRKLIGILREGRPIPLGLIAYSGWGHEVVAFGLETDIDLPPGSYEDYALPGGAWRIKIYDPHYPDCDNVFISLDPYSTAHYEDRINRIRSSTGEMWRGCFVRDDYAVSPPPL